MRLLWLLSGVLLAALIMPAGLPGQTLNPLRLTSPTDGAVVSGTVTIAAEALADLDVAFVVFGIDGDRPVATNARPFVCSWDTRTLADGAHVLFVEAHGPGGVVATAGPIRVIVRNQPTVAEMPVPRGPLAARVVPPVAPRPNSLSQPLPMPRPEVSLTIGEARLPARIRLIEGDAYVPVRPLVECLGGQATWDAQARMVSLWCREREVQLTMGSVVGTLDGSSIRLWRPPTIDAGRTILPARACAQIFNLSVAWDAVYRVVRMGLLPGRPHMETESRAPAG